MGSGTALFTGGQANRLRFGAAVTSRRGVRSARGQRVGEKDEKCLNATHSAGLSAILLSGVASAQVPPDRAVKRGDRGKTPSRRVARGYRHGGGRRANYNCELGPA